MKKCLESYPDATNVVISKKLKYFWKIFSVAQDGSVTGLLKYFWKINPDISNGDTSDLLKLK